MSETVPHRAIVASFAPSTRLASHRDLAETDF
jgi:hypothetical protein